MNSPLIKPRRTGPLVRRMLGLVRPHRGTFIVAMIALAAGSGINLLFPEIIRRILDSAQWVTVVAHPLHVGGLLVGLFALQGVFFYYRSYLFASIGQRVVADLRESLYRSIISQDVQFFDNHRAGDLVSRLSADTLLIQDTVSIKLSVLVRYTFQVVVGIILMLFISWKLTSTIVIVLPLLIGISMVLGRKLRGISKQQQAELGSATTIAEETISGVKVVKAFAQEATEQRRYGNSNKRVLSLGMARSSVSAFFSSFVSFLMNGAIVLVLLYGILLVKHSELSIGDLTGFMLYGVIVAVSFAFIAGTFTEFVQSLGAAERIFEILDSTPGVAASASSGVTVQSEPSRVVFDNVSFRYPARPEVTVLSDLNFTLEPGKVTALVGPSGSGKSTIVNLILRFYEPSLGQILYNGQPLQSLALDDLRSRIAIVPQDSELFAMSIADNLRYGKQTATLEELRAVCEKARILEFIEGLPEKFETNVGPRGMQLSGGQKQRIAIARAMLRDPALLILDEATSALDSENEYLVRQALAELLPGRTTLVIAHRLSTIKEAHQVLVLEKGRLVQQGSHESLARETGLYRSLVERQELAVGL